MKQRLKDFTISAAILAGTILLVAGVIDLYNLIAGNPVYLLALWQTWAYATVVGLIFAPVGVRIAHEEGTHNG